MFKLRPLTSAVLISSMLILTSGCANLTPPPTSAQNDDGAGGAATAKSVADFGGMENLVAAAQKEGVLNVIALPPDWANYGEIMKTFTDTYGIKINSAQPDANSQDEINAGKQLAGGDRAPDVYDLGSNVAIANTDVLAPYKVVAWDDIPSSLKEADGRHVSDYTGFMSVGYDASQVPAPRTMDDLLKPEYKGKVALNGDPTQASAAFHGVMMASLANGGSADDIAPGVEFFAKLKQSGNLLPVDPTPATVASGQTPLVIDWDYLNVSLTNSLKGDIDWQVMVPDGAVVGAYYQQAINIDAPHPAAARLWQEFLYSATGQNLWLQGGARPVLADAMIAAGTIDKAAYSNLPPVSGKQTVLTEVQLQKAQDYLKANWQTAIG